MLMGWHMRPFLISLEVGIGMLALYFFVPFEGLDPQAKTALFVFFYTIMLWIIRPIPEYLSALTAAAFLITVVGLPSEMVLAGFSSLTWWLTLLAMLLGAAIDQTGLGRRIAFIFLARYAKGPLQLLYTTTMVNNLLSPVMPSNSARAAVLGGVVNGMCDSLGFKAGQSKGDHSIVLANMYVNTANTILFLTSTTSNLLGLQILIDLTGAEVTWNDWFIAASVPIIPVLFLLPYVVYKVFPFELGDAESCRAMAREKLAELGPITSAEKRTAMMLVTIATVWCTESFHGIPASQTAFLLVFILMPRIGAVTWEQVVGHISWVALIWLGMAVGLAGIISNTGGLKWVVDTIFSQAEFLKALSFTELCTFIICFNVFAHMFFAGMNAMMMIILPITIAIAQQMGFNPTHVGFVSLLSIAGAAFFMPFNSAPNLIFFSTGRYTVKQQFVGAVPLATLVCLALIFALFVWWPFLGITG